MSFAHALVQHSLYEDLGSARRVRIHRRIADAMEEIYGEGQASRAAELARHFFAATKVSDAFKTLSYSKLAGERALTHLAPGDALGWFRQAIDLYPQIPVDQGLECDLLIGLGTAQRRTGDLDHRQTLLRAASIALALNDGDRLVAAALANNRGGTSASGQVDIERIDVLNHALSAVGPSDSSERARLLAILGSELMYSGERARWSDPIAESLAMARRLDDPTTFLQVTGTVYPNLILPETVDDRLKDLRQALSIAESVGDLRACVRAHLNRAVACLQSADGMAFSAHVDSGSELAGRLGEPFERWSAMAACSMRSLLSGDAVRAEQEARAAFAIGADGVPEAVAVFGGQLMEIQLAQGRWSELTEMAEFMAAAAAENPGLPVLRAGLARAYCFLKRPDDARAVIESDFSDGLAQFQPDTTWLPAMVILSEVCVRLERTDVAATLMSALAPWHKLISATVVTVQGPVALHLGTLASLTGQHDRAQQYLAEALNISSTQSFPYWTARALAEQTRIRRDGGTEAGPTYETTMQSALGIAQAHGFNVVVEALTNSP